MGKGMDKFQARRSKHCKRFATEVQHIKLSRGESMDVMFTRLEELLAKYEVILKEDLYAILELRRRVAEARVLTSIERGCSVDGVAREFQSLDSLGYTDLDQKVVFYKIMWRVMAGTTIRDKARARLASVRTEVRRAMSMLKEAARSLDDLLE
jgi:hypothetical protein